MPLYLQDVKSECSMLPLSHRVGALQGTVVDNLPVAAAGSPGNPAAAAGIHLRNVARHVEGATQLSAVQERAA